MKIIRIYKVLSQAEWGQAQNEGRYHGSVADRRDGFIHFSTRDQLAGTLDKHFAGQSDLTLVLFDAKQLGPGLRWEPSRAGQLFPHLYDSLDPKQAMKAWPLQMGADGRHILPEGLPT